MVFNRVDSKLPRTSDAKTILKLVSKQRLQPSGGGLMQDRRVKVSSLHPTASRSNSRCFILALPFLSWHAMFSPYPVRALPMSLVPHLSLCDAPTLLEVRGQSHYSPSRTVFATMSPRGLPLGRRRFDHDRWRNQRNEVRAVTILNAA